MPDSLELPWMRSAVIKLGRRERFAGLFRRVVNKLIALAHRHSFGRGGRRVGRRSRLEPGLAAVVGALNDLSKPVVGLRRVNAVRIHRRTFDVIDFPPSEVRATNIPLLTFSI